MIFRSSFQRCAAQLGHSLKYNEGKLIAARALNTKSVSSALSQWPTTAQTTRSFSSSVPVTPRSPLAQNPSPLKQLTEETAIGIQNATQLFIQHGLGQQALTELATRAPSGGDTNTLVERWQLMMQTYLGCQLHVLGGMGYPADERGIALYNYQLAQLMQTADPHTQESLRIASRDTWRTVLCLAFDISQEELAKQGELSIVDARDIMYKVSQRMQSPEILEAISKNIGNLEVSGTPQDQLAIKHTMVQQVLISQVYCGPTPSLVEEIGFGPGEQGYVKFQSAMAEYQSDPLVAQYMGGAMMQILRAAGLEQATREMAENMRASASQTN